jgi:hypothetical protein
LPSLWNGLRGSFCFILYILYLVLIALHFIISTYVIYCFTCYTSLYLVDYACHYARVMSYPIFMSKPSTHRMHDPRSIVPHIRPKVSTDNQMSQV